MKHKKLNIALIIISFAALFFYVIYTEGFGNIVNGFKTTNHFILTAAFSLIIAYWFLESVILHLIIKVFHPEQRFASTVRTSMIGQFFNCVTPFASGGQPMQAYSLLKSGVPLGISTCSLLIKFIIYQITLTVYSLAALIFKFNYFAGSISGFKYLVLLGFTVNTVIVAALLSVFFFRNFTLKAARVIINFLHKIKIVKQPEAACEKADKEINEFYRSFTMLKNHFSMVVKCSLLSALQLTVFFMIPYILALAFGIQNISAVNLISAQAFVTMVSSFVPLPGAAGGAELSFYVFFEMYFQKSVSIAMLLWRIITFYLPIAVGIFFVFNRKKEVVLNENEN